jgi:hypothetical protein
MESDTACDSQLNGNSLCTFDQINRSQYVDSPEVDGVQTDHYLWQDPLGTTSMADHELWVTQGDSPVVVQFFANYHPFGQSNQQECGRASDR